MKNKKDIIVVTGGAGFVGSNLIEFLIKKEKKIKIISLDNYSSGASKNHVKNKKIKYLKSDTKNISKILKNYKSRMNTIFHFGEFSIQDAKKYLDSKGIPVRI